MTLNGTHLLGEWSHSSMTWPCPQIHCSSLHERCRFGKHKTLVCRGLWSKGHGNFPHLCIRTPVESLHNLGATKPQPYLEFGVKHLVSSDARLNFPFPLHLTTHKQRKPARRPCRRHPLRVRLTLSSRRPPSRRRSTASSARYPSRPSSTSPSSSSP